MLRARPCRQAQTWGLTYCTVGMPAACSRRASRRLVSGASMPMNTSGRAARNSLPMRASNRSNRGRCCRTSTSPMTANDSAGSQTLHPAACIFGPATPKNSAPGERRRSAWIRSAPKVSPEASPASRPTRNGRNAVAVTDILSDDAAFAELDELDEGPDLRLGVGRLLELLQRRIQFQSRAIEHPIGAADVQNLLGSEAAALQAFAVHAVRFRRPSD